MNDYEESVRLISFKDLLYRTAQQWRRIAVGALIIAMLAALFQCYTGLRVMLSDEKLTEVREKYEIAVNDYQATGKRYQTMIANLRDQSANQQEYNDKSELMKIDPMNKWEGSFQIYVDSKYQIDPSLTYQSPDLTNRLIAAYASYLQSGELYGEIVDNTDSIDEIRYLTEVYHIAADPGNAIITVSTVGKSEADVRALLDLVKLKIAERFDTIRTAIGDHSYEIMIESVISTIDLNLDAKQKANRLAITEYANAIGETSEQLSLWEIKGEPKMEYGVRYTLKRTIFSLVVGYLVGAILMTCWYAAKYAASDTVKTEDDWKSLGIPVLGYLRKGNDRQRFLRVDSWINRVFGKARIIAEEQGYILVSRNLSAILQKQGQNSVWFTGLVDHAFAENAVNKMGSAVPETEYHFAGDSLSDPETVQKLGQTEKVVLLMENGKAGMKSVRWTLTLLQAWGKSVLGVIVVD